MIKLDTSRAKLDLVDILNMSQKVAKIDEDIINKSGEGNDFLGWVDYSSKLSSEEIDKILEVSEKIKRDCEILLVIGIGGSYLGAKAAIDALKGELNRTPNIHVIFLGNTLSPTYTAKVIEYIANKKFAINVISKSGTTTEPALAFRLALNEAKKVWGDKYNEYVIATTDARKGTLHDMAVKEGYTMFVIPDDVGGRFSVFTPVGLVPMAIADIDIKAFIEGAKAAEAKYANPNLNQNDSYRYAVARHLLYKKHIPIEFLVTFEPQFRSLAEWWKQLYGESEGKNHTGLLPDSLCFSTDLHSMGQYCQDGSNIFFETLITVENYQADINIPTLDDDADGLNYLAGKSLSYVQDAMIQSTIDAHHIDGERNNIIISIEKMDEYNLGELMYFFCKACAMSAYLNGVNPFNQPGVEYYKARMKKILKNS